MPRFTDVDPETLEEIVAREEIVAAFKTIQGAFNELAFSLSTANKKLAALRDLLKDLEDQNGEHRLGTAAQSRSSTAGY